MCCGQAFEYSEPNKLELRTVLDLANNKVYVTEKHQKKGKNPGFELQVFQCLVGATLSLIPGGLGFLLEYLLLYCFTLYSTEGLTAICAAAFELSKWN